MLDDSSLIGAIHAITQLLASTLDREVALRHTLEVAIGAVDAEGGSILLHEPASRVLRFCHVVGDKRAELIGFTVREDEGVAGQVFQTAEPRIDNDLANHPRHSHRVDDQLQFETRNLVTAPLRHPGGEVIGVVQLVNKRGGDFTQRDLTLLGIVGSVCAMSVHYADLAKQAERSAALHYLGDLAHDIKNKASPILMGIETLQPLVRDLTARASAGQASPELPGLAAEVLDVLGMVTASAEDIQRYTRAVADAAKGKTIEPVMETGDLGAVVRRQVATLAHAARRQGVHLVQDIAPQVACAFDRLLIERAAYNLVTNAIPETPSGGQVTVRVWRDADHAFLEVRDTGRGMSAQTLHGILRGNAASTKPGGTGLGTTIVKKVVDAHRGRFEGESVAGQGTSLRIALPCR